MSFTFWGLFLVLFLVVAGYWLWMIWTERTERAEPPARGRKEDER